MLAGTILIYTGAPDAAMQLLAASDHAELKAEVSGTGELNFPFILDALDRLRYDGWVGCEYAPIGATLDGPAWAVPYL